MKKKAIYGISALAVVFLLGLSLVTAFQFGEGKINAGLTEEERAEMQEFREAVQEVIENNDYEAWKSLMESRITLEHFETMVERHSEKSQFMEQMQEARENGNFEVMEELKGQYGQMGRSFRGMGGCGL